MKKGNFIVILFSIGFTFMLRGAEPADTNWPAWRGPFATGSAPAGNPPVAFSESENIRWKIPVPGKGLSSPVIWEDQIFITTAVDVDKPVTKSAGTTNDPPLWMKASGQAKNAEKIQQFIVYSISRKTGTILWQKQVREQFPHEGTHKDGSWASHSCVTDGTHIVAFFGSYGLYCFDMKGNLVWEKDLGQMNTSNAFGAGSSPVLYRDKLIVNWDHEGASFITVLDKATGRTLWKKDRDEDTSWSTPLVVESRGKPQVVVSATHLSRAYDLVTGELIWTLGGLTSNVIPSPVNADGIVVLMSGFRGNALQAVRIDKAAGDLQGSDALIWTNDEKITPYVPSPLLFQGKLYFLFGNNAKLSCVDAKTGSVHYSRMDVGDLKGVYASPVGTQDRIYIAGRNGRVAVLKSGPEYVLLKENTLDDEFDASPAIAGDDLILRGIHNLYCISAN